MSTKPDDGGPAFPFESNSRHTGMSMRDWFAGRAMQGFIICRIGGSLAIDETEKLAADAYRVADAMLKARQS